MKAATVTPLLLSPPELEAVTGYRHSKAQAAWLAMKGWRFEINALGRPVVARKYAESVLGCGDDERRARPNFAALRSA